MEFHSTLVPVVGNEADEELIKLACFVAEKNRAKICAVYITRVERQLPLDAETEPETRRTEGILDRVDRVAAGQGYLVGQAQSQQEVASQLYCLEVGGDCLSALQACL